MNNMEKKPQMLKNPNKKRGPLIEEKDFVGAGFKKMDSRYLEDNAPKVNWEKMFTQMERRKGHEYTIDQRMTWFKKFACSMNYAAHMIQGERDQLARFLMKKEAQLKKLHAAMAANNEMLQQEVTRMNEQRQAYNKHVAEINAEVRALKAKLSQVPEVKKDADQC